MRKRLVVATPEEKRRIALVQVLITQLGYPKALIAIEKQLSELPHLLHRDDVPKRRLDILCFAKGINPNSSLFPLLLIECKEGEGNSSAEEQVMGYNHFVGAPFVAVAGSEGPRLIFPQRVDFIPSYTQLIERVSHA